MEFLPSGTAALASLAIMPADVIVSDMRMPGMDGWQLLAEVKRLYPQTVRLVLSGQADATSVMRAVGTAQCYLAKPPARDLRLPVASSSTNMEARCDSRRNAERERLFSFAYRSIRASMSPRRIRPPRERTGAIRRR